jgi:predicted membrane protein
MLTNFFFIFFFLFFFFFFFFFQSYLFTMLSFVFWHQKRLAKQARAQETQAKNASLGKKVKEPPVSKGMKGRGEASFYKVTCKVCQLSILTFYHVCNFRCLDLLIILV